MSRHVLSAPVLIAAAALTLAMAPRTAEANGPFVELHSGIEAPTFAETGAGESLGLGPSFGGAVGLQLDGALGVEFFVQGAGFGEVSGDTSEPELSWTQSAFALALRYEPFVVIPRLRLEAVGGLGVTFLDLEVSGDPQLDQSSSAFTWMIGVRNTVDIAFGIYAGLDIRYLITPTWKDTRSGNQELESFSSLPLLVSFALGYQLDLF